MSIREAMGRHKQATTISAAVVLACALGVLYWTASGGSLAREGHLAWYSDDDGKTWFAEEADKLTPFDHNGKQAVMCFVYSCDGGKTKFSLYLARCNPAGKLKIEDMAKQRKVDPRMVVSGPRPMDVKKPGESSWTTMNDPKAQEIMEPKCPDGSKTDIIMVDPNS